MMPNSDAYLAMSDLHLTKRFGSSQTPHYPIVPLLQVRPKKDAEGTLGLRVSLGTLDQTHRLIGALEELLASPPAKKLKT
eukprot:scaffold64815_cov34-Tisochrysis_lutea.AAC.1